MEIRMRIASFAALFALTGAAPAFAQAALPAGVTQDMVDKGKAVYGGAGLCYACHGAAGQGAVGPKLTERDGQWFHIKGTYPELITYITNGVTKEESKSGIMMPARGGSKISDEDVKNVAAYIYVISRKKA